MTPAQREARLAYQRAWHARRYAAIMADPVTRAAENQRKRQWEQRSKQVPEQPAAPINQEIYRTHGAFAALFAVAA